MKTSKIIIDCLKKDFNIDVYCHYEQVLIPELAKNYKLTIQEMNEIYAYIANNNPLDEMLNSLEVRNERD